MAVKGSGGDLRSIGRRRLRGPLPRQARSADRSLSWRGARRRDGRRSTRCAPSARTASPRRSIRPLHAFLPFPHVDHLHPDWAIALAASANGKAKLEEFNQKYGRKIVWVPWQRPGFELALMLRARGRGASRVRRHHPRRPRPVHLGQDAARVLREQHQAPSIRWVSSSGARDARRGPQFGGPSRLQRRPTVTPSSAASARTCAAPCRRTAASIAHFDGSADALDFANSTWAEDLCATRHELPGSFPAHPHLAAVRAVESGTEDWSRH